MIRSTKDMCLYDPVILFNTDKPNMSFITKFKLKKKKLSCHWLADPT